MTISKRIDLLQADIDKHIMDEDPMGIICDLETLAGILACKSEKTQEKYKKELDSLTDQVAAIVYN